MKRVCLTTWLSAVLVAVVAMLASQAVAAENAPAKAAPAAGEKKAEGRKPYRRLPMYYAQLVDDAQREKIYAIQAEYSDRIDALRAQLAAAQKERDAKVAAVLTPDQQKQLDELKAAAKAARGGKKALKTKKAAPPAAKKPGETAPAK